MFFKSESFTDWKNERLMCVMYTRIHMLCIHILYIRTFICVINTYLLSQHVKVTYMIIPIIFECYKNGKQSKFPFTELITM